MFFDGLEGAAAMDDYSARVGLVQLRGAFTVASSHKLVGVIGKDIREHEIVLFDFSKATYLDDSAGMLIGQLLDVAAKGDTEVIVTGVSGAVAKTLETLDILAAVGEGQVVDTHGRGAGSRPRPPQQRLIAGNPLPRSPGSLETLPVDPTCSVGSLSRVAPIARYFVGRRTLSPRVLDIPIPLRRGESKDE